MRRANHILKRWMKDPEKAEKLHFAFWMLMSMVNFMIFAGFVFFIVLLFYTQ